MFDISSVDFTHHIEELIALEIRGCIFVLMVVMVVLISLQHFLGQEILTTLSVEIKRSLIHLIKHTSSFCLNTFCDYVTRHNKTSYSFGC